jgi:competence protein ComEC
MNHYTRFRAYQLDTKGSSFSLSVGDYFTLCEARYNNANKANIKAELSNIGKSTIDTLHITSWDSDHCSFDELKDILRELKPQIIEYPSENPTTKNGESSLSVIENYQCNHVAVMPELVKSERRRLCGRDVFYNPIENGDKPNDNSVVKLFRVGSFQVLSLGDCESSEIAEHLMKDEILQNEVDIMILAHHGADNGFTTKNFLEAIKPLVCVCTSNYGNQFSHPDQCVRDMCHNLEIPLFTTKSGDIIAETINPKQFRISNYISNNEVKKDSLTFYNKTYYVRDVSQI